MWILFTHNLMLMMAIVRIFFAATTASDKDPMTAD